MSSVFNENNSNLMSALRTKGFDQKYDVKRLLMSTRLYSVYLLSEKEQPRPKDAVMLLEHFPAKEPSVHLLPLKLKDGLSKKEQLQEIGDAVDDYFAGNDQ